MRKKKEKNDLIVNYDCTADKRLFCNTKKQQEIYLKQIYVARVNMEFSVQVTSPNVICLVRSRSRGKNK